MRDVFLSGSYLSPFKPTAPHHWPSETVSQWKETNWAREREGFQAVFHWMDLKGSLSLIKQSPALWFVWLSGYTSAFLQEIACLALCLHPSLKNIWCYVPAFMFLCVIVSSTWLDAEKQNTRWRWTHTKMQGELSLPGPVPLVTSERAATHNFVCHRDPLRKVQLAEVINQGISSFFYLQYS